MTDSAPSNRRLTPNRIAGLFRDTRALGVGAPLRAGYEASKRLGGHALVFRHFVPSSRDVEPGRTPFFVRAVPDSVRDRTIAAADRVVTGTVELFGSEFDVGQAPDWHAVVESEGAWPTLDWWKIDLRSENRAGDVKWAWELGRHRHLVLLARAARLAPANGRYLDTLERHLRSWFAANPPEIGVHWYSNLEIALRSISWLQILGLVEDRLNPDVRARMWRHLRHAGRHLVADLPYTVSTMRNNHLLGDALGLIALGRAFEGKTGTSWYAIGNRIFDRQLSRHMRGDGSMIEDSVSYHRFVLEMLSMRVVLGRSSTIVPSSMVNAAQFLARLGALDGPVPQYGDWDEGRLFQVAKNPTDLAGSVRLALALGGDGAPDSWRDMHDEVAWFTDEGEPIAPEPAEIEGKDIGAGIGRATAGPFTVWLKGGSGPSHGHADLLSIGIAYRGEWIVGDPGTGTYNGPIEQRNYFRGSRAHNVIRVAGEDQLVPHRAFRWVHQARGTVGEPIRFGDMIVMWAVHDAYARLDPPRRLARVAVVRTEQVEVTDYVEGPPIPVDLALPLHPTTSWSQVTATIDVEGEQLRLDLPPGVLSAVRGSHDPYSGWWSNTYGAVEPSTLLGVASMSEPPLKWGVRKQSDAEDGPSLEDVGQPSIAVLFDETAVWLRVGIDGRVFLRCV